VSIILAPRMGGARSAADASPVGRLTATMLQVAVAGVADPQRFRRGKAYAVDRAVARIEVSAGLLRATVAGSRPGGYQVTVGCALVARPQGMTGDRPERQHISALAPEGDDLDANCSCPDWDDPCKHAVAVLLAFADECLANPELLVAWRCGDGEPTQRRKVGARASGAPTPPAPPAGPREQNLFDTDEWTAFVGAGLPPIEPPEFAEEPAPLGRSHLDRVDIAAVITSAVDVLRS
jgi:hypothetical protein